MERKDNSGALFKVDEVKSDKHPVYTGTCLVNGKKMNIGAWINTSKAGKQYMSLKFDEYKPKGDYPTYTTTSTALSDEEVPF